MIRSSAWAALACALLWAAGAIAEDAKSGGAKPDAAKGQTIASQVCAACHAADGNSIGPANPKLAGQGYDYLHKQLTNFKPQNGKKAKTLSRRQRGLRGGGLRRLPRPGRRWNPGSIPAHRGPVRRVRRGAAQGFPQRRARKRSERHDAHGQRAHDRPRDPGRLTVRRRAALSGRPRQDRTPE